MNQNDQMVALPPLVITVSESSMSSANLIDGVTGMPIPSLQVVYINGLPRDARFPERVDNPNYPLILTTGTVPPEQENLVWQAGGQN